jgi:hypothetical protein
VTDQPLADLEEQRARLFEQLAGLGDFRPGSVNATYRRCGKPNCTCAQEGHPGHGPRYLWTRSAGGRTRSRQLSGTEVGKVRREVANYREFLAVSEQIVEVSEAICEARPPGRSAEESPAGPAGERGGSGRRSRRRPPRR